MTQLRKPSIYFTYLAVDYMMYNCDYRSVICAVEAKLAFWEISTHSCCFSDFGYFLY